MNLACRLLLVLLLLGSGSPALADGGLRIATEGAYPPFNYMDELGEPAGFDVDIARALCEAMGRPCTVLVDAWGQLIPGLEAGRYDMVVASMAETPERSRLVDFSHYYYRSRSSFVADPGREFIQTPGGLADKSLAAQAGTAQAGYLRRTYGATSKIVLTATLAETLGLLEDGRVDAALVDSLAAFRFLQTDKGARFDFVGVPLPADDPSSTARIAVRKGNRELLDAIDSAIKTIRQDGTYDRINRKYFPFSIY
ncbi:transporter substrate-binding domain-containing protein [Pseudodesulfovibrio sp.]|uniref:transporter substrate-binding domain-containing protein n=1 Tax=Pseudodesulfovibrio sp. TaxID=2035812 RepID=UPI00263683BD|nr:transporter substrate-binding domain-containing protein [Pseudodesulfovibrio sp.]MDD3312445.1 transporter substrate-binding domain-containing protein [Pseudodesulfovibrio sp.]